MRVECEVYYPDTGERFMRVIDWDDFDQRSEFAKKADKAIRNGGIVTTRKE